MKDSKDGSGQKLVEGIPADVRQALDALRAGMERGAPAKVESLAVYGGLARGRYVPGRSDVNLLIVLKDATPTTLKAIGGPLREARREVNVEPFILTPEDVKSATECFPTKMLDIRDHHVLLHGKEPLAGLELPAELVRARVREELLNLRLRLRRRFAEVHDDPAAMAEALSRMTPTLAVQLSVLMRLKGGPGGARDRGIFAAASAQFGLDAEALEQLRRMRAGEEAKVPPDELFARVNDSISKLLAFLERKEG